MTQAIDWAAFPGPTYYRPDEVPQVFEALASAANYEEADAAYTKLTYTVGNGHAGTFYPAAVAAVPKVIELALHGAPWTRWAAAEVLVDWVWTYEADAEFAVVSLPDGRTVDVTQTVRAQISSATPALRRSLDAESDEIVRGAMEELVHCLETGDWRPPLVRPARPPRDRRE